MLLSIQSPPNRSVRFLPLSILLSLPFHRAAHNLRLVFGQILVSKNIRVPKIRVQFASYESSQKSNESYLEKTKRKFQIDRVKICNAYLMAEAWGQFQFTTSSHLHFWELVFAQDPGKTIHLNNLCMDEINVSGRSVTQRIVHIYC